MGIIALPGGITSTLSNVRSNVYKTITAPRSPSNRAQAEVAFYLTETRPVCPVSAGRLVSVVSLSQNCLNLTRTRLCGVCQSL